MAGVKPLIFIQPLSETLQKLKEVLEETAEDEGLVIHEAEEVKELTKLLATVGPSLTLFAHPKKCAISLQTHRKFVKRFQAKTILLTSKQIPRKTLDKFMKVGLTDCIVEPIAPKTLLYKVRLLLRSLPSTDETEEEDYNTKFGDGGPDEVGEGAEVKNLDQQEVEAGEGPLEVGDSDSEPVGEEALDDLKGQLTGEEEDIDGFYRGALAEQQEIEEDEGPETKSKDDVIDTHYKGDVGDPSADKIDDENMSGEVGVDEISNADNIHKQKMLMDLDIEDDEEDFTDEKEIEEEELEAHKKSMALDIEDDSEEEELKEENELENSDTHYRSKVAKKIDVEEDDDDDDDFNDENTVEEDTGPMVGKLSQAMEVEEDDDEVEMESDDEEKIPDHMTGKLSQALDVEEEEEEEKEELIEEDEEEAIKKSMDLDIDDDEDLEEHKLKKEKDIDGYIRGGAAKKVDLEEEEEEESYLAQMIKKKKMELDEEDEDDDETEMAEVEVDDDLMRTKSLQAIDIEEDEEEEEVEPEEQELEEDDEIKKDLETDKINDDGLMRGKISNPLETEEEDDDESTFELEDDDDDMVAKKKSMELDVDDDGEKKKRKLNKADDIEKYMGRDRDKVDKKIDDNWDANSGYREDEVGHRSHSAKVDQIDSYYGRKKKKQDDAEFESEVFSKDKEGYSGEKKKKLKEEEEVQKKKVKIVEEVTIDYSSNEEEDDRERSLIREKEDLGEQTIDYKKLKEEFDDMESWGGQLKTRYKIEEGGSKKTVDPVFKTVKKVIMLEDGTEQIVEEEVEVEAEDEIVYHPDSKGLEIAIQALNIYENKKSRPIEMFTFLGNVIKNRYGGMTTFVMRNKDTGEFEDQFVAYEALSKNDLPYEATEEEGAWPNPAELVWDEFRSERLEKWTHSTLPLWSDETFQAKQIEFIYPFFEGVQTMGFVVVQFYSGLNEEVAGRLEVYLESTRGLYLENFHKGALKGEYKGTAKKKDKDAKGDKKKGLFGKMFGKKAS